jgi:anaerobic magnesium-protoporphyrin IX monomethyl ester cyclase
MVPDEVVRTGPWDVVAVGEAELALRELCDRLDRGEAPTSVPNMRFPARSRWNPTDAPIVNPVGPFPDLRTIAANDLDLFDVRRITRSKNGWLGLLTSRGCPYKCTYCFNKEIVDRYVADGAVKSPKEFLRHYPVERVIAEIKELVTRHPEGPDKVTTLIFDDDLFTLDRDYVRDFCLAYKASGVGLPFVVNAHVQVFDEDMAFQLADAGCTIVKYGLESGSKRVRSEVLWRWMTNDKIKQAFAAAHQYGLHSSAFVMFGLPTETRADLMDTLRLIAETELGRFRWALFFPFPGTAGHRISEQLGLIDPTKLQGVGNYFEGSCLRWPDDLALLLEKLGRVSHWWVNTFSPWPGCAEAYRPLVAEVESWSRAEWEARRGELHARDRALSEQLLRDGVRHYSLRYTHVMGVDSAFVLAERARMRAAPEYVPVGYTLDD